MLTLMCVIVALPTHRPYLVFVLFFVSVDFSCWFFCIRSITVTLWHYWKGRHTALGVNGHYTLFVEAVKYGMG